MGMPSSKFGKEIQNSELLEGSVPSTPILTPKVSRIEELDPRSPSLHIARTPLELLSAAAEKLEPYEQETPIRNKHLIIDPRSPTVDFKRTPIIVSSPGGDLLRKLHNKNLEKACLAEIQAPPSSNEKTSVPPKLLESSPIKSRSDAHKRRSLVGLLETNIDYTETDLDLILQEKCTIEENDIKTDLSEVDKAESFVQINVSNDEHYPEENLQDLTPEKFQKVDSDSESVEMVKHAGTTDLEEVQSVDVHVFVPNEKQCYNTIEDATNSSTKLSVETDLLKFPKATTASESSILSTKEIKSKPIPPSFVNLTADVKELDKKLTNLIYEDDLVVCPRIVQLKENTERSPLKNRNGNEFAVKTTQKLKVSDKPRKSDYVVSKIPVFKEKRNNIKKHVQCENTPPRNMDKSGVRTSDWDNKDTTLYL